MTEFDFENYINLLLFETGKQEFIESSQAAVALLVNNGGVVL